MSGFIFSIVDSIARETFQERLDYPSHRLMFSLRRALSL
jgi:hypothetical protein